MAGDRAAPGHAAGCALEGCACRDGATGDVWTPDMRVAYAVGVIALRLRFERHGGWRDASDADRRAFARRALRVRLRANRAGLLRWRVEPAGRIR
jgi:hypothetical protein